MSESNEWKNEMTGQELNLITGGKAETDAIEARVYYRCETCGKTWKTMLSNFGQVPECCGMRMKLDHWDRL